MKRNLRKMNIHENRGPDPGHACGFFCLIILSGFIFCGEIPAFAVASGHEFGRYQLILDKKPFGEVAPSESAATQPALGDVLAKDLEMKSIIDDGTGIRVGLFDKKTNKNVSLIVGEEYEGVQLVSVNYDNEEAVLKKGSETAMLKLHPDKDKDKDKMASTPALPAVGTGGLPQPPANPFAAAVQEASSGARKPFFTDLKKRRMSPFQPIGTNTLPFQAKPLDSFFKVSTGAFPSAQSPFGPFQAPQGSAQPGGFQQMPAASNAPNPFVPISAPSPGASVDGRGATINQLMQGQPNQVPATEEIIVEEVEQ
jgi:hypothetical protein